MSGKFRVKLLLSEIFVRPGLLIQTNCLGFFVPNNLFIFIVKSNFSLFQESKFNFGIEAGSADFQFASEKLYIHINL